MLAAAILSGCEENVPLYDSPDNRLVFLYGTETGYGEFGESESSKNYALAYTFFYNDLERDVVQVKVKTIGFLADTDRPVELEQVATDGKDAMPGVHYVAFDDPSYSGKFVIPAGATTASLPITVIRDKSLGDGLVNLRLRVKDNGVFSSGFEKRAEILVTISVQLARPANWGPAFEFEFGQYGPEKHAFMVRATGEKIDEEYLSDLGFGESGYYNEKYDSGYSSYMKDWFNARLAEENAERAEQELGPLAEADGTVVKFERS